MAFQFVPNADGSFDEGMRQTNPETGVEYLFTDGAWRPLGPKIEDQFDELDERYVQKSGDTMEGKLRVEALIAIDKPDKSQQFKITPNASDYFTNIYAYNADGNNGGVRFRVAPGDNQDDYKTFLQSTFTDNVVGETTHPVRTELNWLRTPTSPHHAANKQYVDETVAGSGGGVPVGTIMIWLNSAAPDGWFKLQGGSFNTSTYPELHTYLQATSGYVDGVLPDWSGRYPGEYGDHITDNLGSFKNYRTAKPITDFTTDDPGDHEHRMGNTGTVSGSSSSGRFWHDINGSKKTSANGAHTHTITGGGDSTTRPRTVVVHYIIKHD